MKNKKQRSANLETSEFYGCVARTRYSPSFVLSELIQNQQTTIPKHSHELAFFDLLINGNYYAKHGKNKFSCNSMTVLWCPPDFTHKAEIGKKGGHFFTIEVSKNNLELFQNYSFIPESFFTRKSQMVSLAMCLYNEFKNWQDCSSLTVEGLTLEMLGVLAQKEKFLDEKPPAWLLHIVDKLNEEFKESFSTKELSIEAGVHPVHLAKVFRKFHNQTINEYVQNLRINYASKLLCNKDLPLTEIAAMTGFADQSHLTRIFKRITQTTPGVFRDSLK